MPYYQVNARASSLGLPCDSPEEKQQQQHEQRQEEERKPLGTRSGTSGACFQTDDQKRMETDRRPYTVVQPASCLQRCAPFSLIGELRLGQHLISGVNILLPIKWDEDADTKISMPSLQTF